MSENDDSASTGANLELIYRSRGPAPAQVDRVVNACPEGDKAGTPPPPAPVDRVVQPETTTVQPENSSPQASAVSSES